MPASQVTPGKTRRSVRIVNKTKPRVGKFATLKQDFANLLEMMDEDSLSYAYIQVRGGINRYVIDRRYNGHIVDESD